MRVFYLWMVFLILPFQIWGQPFTNPSFEGTIRNSPPDKWTACTISASTPDLQPGVGKVSIPAYEGTHYLGMVTRGGTCVECNESIYQELLFPLKVGTCYTFDVFLNHQPDGYDNRYTEKAILRIWGGHNSSSDCGKAELLWVSPLPNSNIWTKYQVQMLPRDTYSYITLEAYYPNVNKEAREGHILIDYLSNFQINPFWEGFELPKDTTICRYQDLVLQVNLPDNQANLPILWSTGETSSKIIVTEPGIYRAEVYHPCRTYKDSIEVKQEKCVFIPNVFTPNQDGQNESFYIEGIQKGNWQLQVYDRRGTLVYENQTYQNDWTGQSLPNAVYYYYLINRETKENYKGWVEIMR